MNETTNEQPVETPPAEQTLKGARVRVKYVADEKSPIPGGWVRMRIRGELGKLSFFDVEADKGCEHCHGTERTLEVGGKKQTLKPGIVLSPTSGQRDYCSCVQRRLKIFRERERSTTGAAPVEVQEKPKNDYLDRAISQAQDKLRSMADEGQRALLEIDEKIRAAQAELEQKTIAAETVVGQQRTLEKDGDELREQARELRKIADDKMTAAHEFYAEAEKLDDAIAAAEKEKVIAEKALAELEVGAAKVRARWEDKLRPVRRRLERLERKQK